MRSDTVASYDGGKQMAGRMAAIGKVTATKPAAVGDDAYYFIAGNLAALLVKKGGVTFRVTVYARIQLDQKEGVEMALAKEALAKL